MKINTVTVWHAKEPTWGESDPVWNPENFEMVAIIEPDPETGEARSVDTAYELTNHIDCAWWENEGVTRVGPEARSTSVGDVIVRNEEVWLCARVGWTRLNQTAA
jgi:hypothetical protein